MQKVIQFVARCIDSSTGDVIEECIMREETVAKAPTLKELGYLHVEQIEFLQQIQDFKIKHQILLNTATTCPTCSSKTGKHGLYKSQFHAVLTDHLVTVQRRACKCGWVSATSVEGIFGTNIHPDLLKKQALQGCNSSYEKSSKHLNAESCKDRSINGHSQIHRTVKLIGETLEQIKLAIKPLDAPDTSTSELIVNVDGGHIKARGDNRSFEAMVATVYQPKNLKPINKNHNAITAKSIVASAKDDTQATMKGLFRGACIIQGMGIETSVVCLADGAENCKAIADSIASYCKTMVYILDWFHISMKFKNIAVPVQYKELFDKIKWQLWHGNPKKALLRLDEFKKLEEIAIDESLLIKLNKLSTYIGNNKDGIISYEARKNAGLLFTSNLAESNVNTIINDRQKGKQKMLWGREGAHNVLQIRTAVRSESWKDDWNNVESMLYKLAA